MSTLLPPELQETIQQALGAVRTDPDHNLNGFMQWWLYRSFGPSRLDRPDYRYGSDAACDVSYKVYYEREWQQRTAADLALGWLAFLTARKIRSIWYRSPHIEDYYADELNEMIELMGGLLMGAVEWGHGYWLKADVYYYTGDVISPLPFEVNAAWEAVYSALGVVLYGIKTTFMTDGQTFEDAEYLTENFASAAAVTYCAHDLDPPEIVLWALPNHKDDQEDEINDYRHIEYDNVKKREFWEWWLSEAIRQAWALATQGWAIDP